MFNDYEYINQYQKYLILIFNKYMALTSKAVLIYQKSKSNSNCCDLAILWLFFMDYFALVGSTIFYAFYTLYTLYTLSYFYTRIMACYFSFNDCLIYLVSCTVILLTGVTFANKLSILNWVRFPFCPPIDCLHDGVGFCARRVLLKLVFMVLLGL